MSVEVATTINQLDATLPTATDPRSEGDDHIRLVKSTVKATFPNVTGAVTATHTQINAAASHITDTANPHATTKAQVGLSNVDNTSDLNKPISTATQTALDAKLDTSNIKTVNGASLVGSGDVVVGSGISISDGSTSLTSVWSSTKTNTELGTKQATLVSGTNIKTINGNALTGSGNVVIPSGALVYLGAVTASGAATVDVTGLDTYGATYDRLVLIASDVRASVSNNELVVTMQDSGTWRTSGHVYNRTQRPGPGTPVDTFSPNISGNANIPLCLLTGNVPADYASLRLDIHKPSATCRFEWTASSKSSGVSMSFEYVFGSALHNFALAPLQGLRFALVYGGNITGTFRLYGIANA